MKNADEVHFQETVSQFLIRHRSILDVQSKLTEAAAHVNRAVAKSVTTCGCISISADRQRFPADVSLREVRELLATHLNGTRGGRGGRAVGTEMGDTVFYWPG